MWEGVDSGPSTSHQLPIKQGCEGSLRNVIALLAPHGDGKDDQAREADYRDTRHEQDPIDHSAPIWDRVNSLLGPLDKPVR